MDEDVEYLSLAEEPKSANRLFFDGVFIAFVFATSTVVIGFTGIALTGGISDKNTQQYALGIVTSHRIWALFWFSSILVPLWTVWFWWLYRSVREFRSLSAEEWRSRPADLVRIFRDVHDIPYLGALASIALWVGGGFGAIWFFRDLSVTFYWVVPVLAICTSLSINLPQIYAQRSLLRPLENEIRALNPAINVSDVKRRVSISRKLRAGLLGLLAFTLGVAFMVSFVLVERYRVQDRIERLESQIPIYEDWIRRVNPTDQSPEEVEQWAAPLRNFHIGSQGGPILYDITEGRFIVNVPAVAEDHATVEIMLGAKDGFAEDYKTGTSYRSLPENLFEGLPLRNQYRIVLAEPHGQGTVDFLRNTLVVYALVSLLCFVVSYYLSNDLVIPIKELLKYTKRVGQGRLIKRRPFVTGDELGQLAEETAQTVTNIAGIVADIQTAGISLGEASRSVAEGSISLAEGSRNQLVQAESTARAVDLLATRLEGSKQEIDRLEEAVSASSSAAIELHVSAQQVNETTTHLATETENIRVASDGMVASTESLTSRLVDLETYTDQTVTAVKLIDDRVNALREEAALSEQLSSDVLANTQAGRDALAATVQSITASRRLVLDTADIIVSLRNRNRAINEIIETIRSVASRTTLLSLNASILAAQAGQHGASFQVVAEEIRQLAYGTTARAREIAELIETIQVETENAAQAIEQVTDQADRNVTMAEGTSKVLDEITRKAEGSLAVVERTSRAVDDQSRSAREINEVVRQLGDLVREFTQLGETQRDMGGRIALGIDQVRDHVRRVGRASSEQVRASGQVTDGVETVAHTLQSVLRTLNEEIGASGEIRQSAGAVRETASRSTVQTDELVRLSADLQKLASLLQADVGRFRVESE